MRNWFSRVLRKPEPDICKCSHTIILRGKRGDEWALAIGTRELPVTAAEPEQADVLGDRHLVFFLDLTRIDWRTRDRLEHHLTERYGKTLDEVKHEMLHGGVPILARGLRTPNGLEI